MEKVSAWTQQAQDQTEQSCRWLNDLITRKLRTELVKVFEEMSQKEIAAPCVTSKRA
ncbi:hypothetical protein GPEL0_01r3991 [Geoanaerobacter pelophilus]|uniref:Uncharacterized protein n=1 Tax=Geoanaerobacter pelophilus TaxID=60036 RepID=A0ABQ0MLK5_9BACT|nr:hypothetical protein GPEL0_01r3991 [Geoanaerobacter pelophilus]